MHSPAIDIVGSIVIVGMAAAVIWAWITEHNKGRRK